MDGEGIIALKPFGRLLERNRRASFSRMESAHKMGLPCQSIWTSRLMSVGDGSVAAGDVIEAKSEFVTGRRSKVRHAVV